MFPSVAHSKGKVVRCDTFKMATKITKRFIGRVQTPLNSHEQSMTLTSSKGILVKTRKECFFAILLGYFLGVWMFLHIQNSRYPLPITKSSANFGDFVEENARKHLVDITNLGPRPVGSVSNEVQTVQYLLSEIERIKQSLNSNHDVDIDIQTVSGTFSLSFLGEFTSYYDNVQNVVVKLKPRNGEAKDSVMVNCHYDSVINGTGASDDAITCSLMLEVLRVMSQNPSSFTHSVIFLFNGAEENILQASHGFITQHPWASEIKAFVNLDSAGAGGKELLFQAGPENPWMIHAYAQSAPHPFATVIGQDVFQSGLIPSDTDYRIFRDYGHLPGLDIAYITNGYIYHTQHDTPDMIPPGCIQRGGDNLLAILKNLADSPLVSDPREYRHGKVIFFDIVGFYMVVYPARIGNILNMAVALTVIVGLFHKARKSRQGVTYIKEHLVAIGLLILSWLSALFAAVVTALTLDVVGASLSWYTNAWLLLPLYACPSFLTLLTIHSQAKKLIYSKKGTSWETENTFFASSMLIFSCLLVFLTYNNIGSAVLLLLLVLCPLIIRQGGSRLLRLTPISSPRGFLGLHLAGVAFPSVMFLYAIYGILTMFVPIMGRAGTEAVPDIFIGCLVSVAVIVVSSHCLGVVYVCDSVSLTRKILTCVYLTGIALALFTPEGFPFGSHPRQPTKQRHFVHHISRTMHDISGSVTQQDSGLLHIGFDRRKMQLVQDALPDLALTDEAPCDSDRPYCGWPYYLPLLNRMRDVHYVTAAPPEVTEHAQFTVLSRTEEEPGHINMTFSVTGPPHVNLYLTPRDGVTLSRWSIGNHDPMPTEMPPGMDRETYFVYYAYGLKPAQPWQFWLEIQVDEAVERETGVLDIAVGAHYLTYNGKDAATPELDRYIGAMPDFTTPIGWVATYQAWVL